MSWKKVQPTVARIRRMRMFHETLPKKHCERLVSRWGSGIYLGVNESSQELIMGIPQGAVKASEFKRKGSEDFEVIGGKVSINVDAGDVLRIETPGGGGYGPKWIRKHYSYNTCTKTLVYFYCNEWWLLRMMHILFSVYFNKCKVFRARMVRIDNKPRRTKTKRRKKMSTDS